MDPIRRVTDTLEPVVGDRSRNGRVVQLPMGSAARRLADGRGHREFTMDRHPGHGGVTGWHASLRSSDPRTRRRTSSPARGTRLPGTCTSGIGR